MLRRRARMHGGLDVQFLKNQVAKEIGLSLASIPFMGALTTPIILAEIYGYSKCYDNVRPLARPPSTSPLRIDNTQRIATPHCRTAQRVALRSFLTPFFAFFIFIFSPNLVSFAGGGVRSAVPHHDHLHVPLLHGLWHLLDSPSSALQVRGARVRHKSSHVCGC
jgi:hypothetical protein